MKPIQTIFGGYRFRSRLEARWAVFLTALGFSWDYEFEGFHLDDGQKYLPDLRVRTPQGQTMWVEIKPSYVDTDPKFAQFQKELEGKDRSFLASGDPLEHLSKVAICPRCGMSEPLETEWIRDVNVNRLKFTEYCFHCDCETPCGGDNPVQADGVCGVKYQPHKGDIYVQRDELVVLERKLVAAATKARQARFEHGEQG